jgi:pimeloyl-ACP methyl ester carboxylesterase
VGERITANGVDVYYERAGRGDPLLLLHGLLSSSSDMAMHTEKLAEHFDVLTADRRAHGRTPDVAGPITYEIMADDMISFMDALGIESAHVVGYSDGAIVGLHMAIAHPERIRRLVAISANVTLDGLTEDAKTFFLDTPADAVPDALIDGYRALSPDGKGRFPVVWKKLQAMLREMTPISPGVLGQIARPTLVMCADDDLIRLDQTIEIFRAIPGAQLCVVPGTSHLMPFEKPELMLGVVAGFLTETGSSKIEMS